jgi:5-methylcytosine-specific restriction endonuclease McrA
MKSCTNPNCDQINPQELSSFYKRKDTKSGLTSWCKACLKVKDVSYYLTNTEKVNARQKAYRLENDEKEKTRHTAYYLKNAEKIKIAQMAYQLANPEKVKATKAAYIKENSEKVKKYQADWTKANSGKVNAKTNRRRAAKLNATPKCLTIGQKLEMQALYIEAARLTKETGIPHEVDHEIPLQGENVSGLHVPWNLQILTRSENRKKHNKIIV